MEAKVETENENEEKDDDGVHYTLAQLYQYAAQNVDDYDHDNEQLDEKAKLVLKRLLDGATATDHTFQFQSQSQVAERTTSSANEITLQRGQTSNELLKLQPTSNRVASSSNIPSSVKSVSCSPNTWYSKKRSRIYEENRANRLSSSKEISSHDKGYYYNNFHAENISAVAFLEKSKRFENCKKLMDQRSCSVMGQSSDATSSLALWISQSGANQLEHLNKNRHDTLGVSDYDLAEATEKTEENTFLDYQVLSWTGLNPVEKACIGIDMMREKKERTSRNTRPAEKPLFSNWTAKSVSDGSSLQRNKSPMSAQMPNPKLGSIKDTTRSGLIPTQKCKSIQRETSFLSRTEDQIDDKGRIVLLADQKTPNSRNALLSQQLSQKTMSTGLSSHTKSRNQKCNAGMMPTSTSGPTLLRTATVGRHNKIDQTHYLCDSNQGSTCRTGFNTSTEKEDQRHQVIGLPTLLEQKASRVKNVTSSRYHQRRSLKSSNVRPSKHMPLQQESETSWTSSSSLASSYSSLATPGTSYSESDESLPSRTMAHRRGDPTSYLSHERSMRPSRRISPYSMDVGRPHQGDDAIVRKKSIRKQIGRLQRFKNKLGLIFHHHHHHHHHHHDGATDGGDMTVLKTNYSFWKSLGRRLHRERSAGPRKQQVEYGLMDGFIRHMRHLKKSKRPVDIKKLGKANNHEKKKVKKWNWWQKKFKRKAVVRQTSGKKPRVRAGFKPKKPPLKAIKY